MQRSGLLNLILPELAALDIVEQKDGRKHKNNFYHTLEVLENVVKTHPQPLPVREGSDYPVGEKEGNEVSTPLPHREGQGESLLRSLPEYQLLQKQVEATKLQRKMEVGKNLPTVGIGTGYNYHNLLDNNHTFGMVFATVSVPISDWWGGSHAIRRKKIAEQQAQEQLADNAELLQIRMQNAWNNVAEARQQLQIAGRSIEQAEENLRLNRDYYRAGTTKMSDLLEAQLLYQQALDRRTDAYADYQNRLLEYRQATGQ